MIRIALWSVVAAAPLVAGCGPPFPEAVRGVEIAVVYEGLPHQGYEPTALKAELANKPTVELNGFPFYQEPLSLSADDLRRLAELLGNAGTYEPFRSGKCGVFHPDYAVEWQLGGRAYRVLLCFGCNEANVSTPSGVTPHKLAASALGQLQEMFKPYRKNRPAINFEQ